MSHSSLRIGLTGGIASGKSAAARHFMALGVPLINADQVARDIVAPGEPCLAAIAETFGQNMLLPDGNLNRPALRALVFADADARGKLEAITHPEIGRRIRAWLAAQKSPYVILESPLLLETRQHEWVNRVLVIDVPEALQIERAVARDGVPVEQAKAILAAQMPRALRQSRADDIITNNKDLAVLQAAVEQLHTQYLALATQPSQWRPHAER
ncbi:MAG: dephospho-CoA kinase [Hahellaceae bacterium]|nr:dephospho-CoA kinase [Hahellaceae bacterium]